MERRIGHDLDPLDRGADLGVCFTEEAVVDVADQVARLQSCPDPQGRHEQAGVVRDRDRKRFAATAFSESSSTRGQGGFPIQSAAGSTASRQLPLPHRECSTPTREECVRAA